MLRTILLVTTLAAVELPDRIVGYESGMSTAIHIPEMVNLNNGLFSRSLRPETFAIAIVSASESKNRYLDAVIKKYTNFAPVIVKKFRKNHRPESSDYKFNSNVIGLIFAVYDTTGEITVEELQTVFGCIWTPRSRIVLWICGEVDRPLDQVLVDFWKHDILNVNIIARNSSTGEWQSFTYNPFEYGENGTRGVMKKLDSNTEEMFPNKLANLNNYSIPISVFYHFPTSMMTPDFQHLRKGADVELLRMISRLMNFNVDLKTANSTGISYVTTLRNNQSTGIVGDILNGRSDVVWNRHYVDNLPVNFVETTYPYHTIRSCVVVRKAEQISMIGRMLLPFPWIIWPAFFTVLCVLVMFMIIGKERNILPRTIYLILFQSLGKIPKRDFVRIYSISWIFWSLLMTVIYQSYLVKDLILPRHLKDLDTLEDLYDQNVTLYVGYNAFSAINNSKIEALRRLVNRTEIELNFHRCIDRVLKLENVACAAQGLIAQFIPMQRVYRGKNGPRLHKMEEHLTDHWEAFVVKRGFPYLDMFNHLIGSLVEGGFYEKWMRDALEWFVKNEPKYGDSTFSLKHLHAAFSIIVFGLGISTLTFFLEIFSTRWSSNVAKSVPSQWLDLPPRYTKATKEGLPLNCSDQPLHGPKPQRPKYPL